MSTPAPASPKAIITNAAQRYGIEPSTLWGVFGVETHYGEDVKTSSAGAEGPLQLEPATARSLGVKNPNDLAEAANGAARYLAQYKSRGLGGMLSAYNAGPAGGYQDSYVKTALQDAGTYNGKSVGVASTGSAAQPVALPGRPTASTASSSPTGPVFDEAGYRKAETGASIGKLFSSADRQNNPLFALGILSDSEPSRADFMVSPESGAASKGAPKLAAASQPGSTAASIPTALPNPPAGLNLKPVTPPVKVTLPRYITGKGYPAVEKAKTAEERALHHPISVEQLSVDVKQNPQGVQEDLNNTYGTAPVVAESPKGKVVQGATGPVYVPHQPQRPTIAITPGGQEHGAPGAGFRRRAAGRAG